MKCEWNCNPNSSEDAVRFKVRNHFSADQVFFDGHSTLYLTYLYGFHWFSQFDFELKFQPDACSCFGCVSFDWSSITYNELFVSFSSFCYLHFSSSEGSYFISWTKFWDSALSSFISFYIFESSPFCTKSKTLSCCPLSSEVFSKSTTAVINDPGYFLRKANEVSMKHGGLLEWSWSV